MRFPRIWTMTGPRRGDDAQACALAEELRLPFESRKLLYNWRFWLGGRFMGASAISVIDEVRRKTLVPPWPDLIIVVGKRAVPAARWVKEQSGGGTMLVLVGHPRVDPRIFDIVYATRQYLTPEIPPVRMLPVTMSPYRAPANPTDAERAWLECLRRPLWLLMLGGETKHWKMEPSQIAGIAAKLAYRASREGGSVVVARSARTSDAVLDAVEARLEGDRCEWRVLRDDFPRFPVLLEGADLLFPTADSISMISESVISGKPVGIVRPEMSWRGHLQLGNESRMRTNPRRDLRRFWNFLLDNQLAGTMEEPRASNTPNPVGAAAKEVRALLEGRFGELPA
ncbi:MAG TPA: ELM1/GtrOC1 family putative glycosyltransferase [Sphingomicrobium sp.]|nr:ELM1/GtrOC1 family putative glycosyltransferase [Sphingomicrobium sp.]